MLVSHRGMRARLKYYGTLGWLDNETLRLELQDRGLCGCCVTTIAKKKKPMQGIIDHGYILENLSEFFFFCFVLFVCLFILFVCLFVLLYLYYVIVNVIVLVLCYLYFFFLYCYCYLLYLYCLCVLCCIVLCVLCCIVLCCIVCIVLCCCVYCVFDELEQLHSRMQSILNKLSRQRPMPGARNFKGSVATFNKHQYYNMKE